jgi:hypothetical protein
LAVLLLHLLKWRFQPSRRGASWQATIRVQRRDLSVHMSDNPSLRSVLPQAIDQAYGNVTIEAAAEIGLPETTFPQSCPWSYDQIMNADFWPEAAWQS